MAGLVAHVGRTWGWANEIVRTGSVAERPTPPESREEDVLLGWAGDQAERLLTTLRAAEPDSECWTFGTPRTRRFWIRRQALETVLHSWDGENACGAAAPIDPEIAADGVDEFLTVMVPRRLGNHPGPWSGQSIHLHRTDGDGEWLLRLGPEGASTVDRAHGKGDLALRGAAESLWLWCTNRVPVGDADLELFGDRAIAERWAEDIVI